MFLVFENYIVCYVNFGKTENINARKERKNE